MSSHQTMRVQRNASVPEEVSWSTIEGGATFGAKATLGRQSRMPSPTKLARGVKVGFADEAAIVELSPGMSVNVILQTGRKSPLT